MAAVANIVVKVVLDVNKSDEQLVQGLITAVSDYEAAYWSGASTLVAFRRVLQAKDEVLARLSWLRDGFSERVKAVQEENIGQ